MTCIPFAKLRPDVMLLAAERIHWRSARPPNTIAPPEMGGIGNRLVCSALTNAAYFLTGFYATSVEKQTLFAVFCPHAARDAFIWGFGDNAHEERILALLLLIEMQKDACRSVKSRKTKLRRTC